MKPLAKNRDLGIKSLSASSGLSCLHVRSDVVRDNWLLP